MPTLYKRKDSPYWWAWGYRADGTQWKRSTRQRQKRAAEKAARSIERDELGETDDPYPPVPLHEAMDILLAHKRRKRCAPSTLQMLSEKRKRLEQVLGRDRDVLTLTLADMQAYLDTRRRDLVKRHGELRPTSDHTISKEVATLKSALRQLRRHDLYPGDPAAIWPEELTDVYQPRTRWLTVDEYARLLGALPAHRRRYVVLYCQTGMRYSELYQCRRERDSLVVTQTKGNRQTGTTSERLVPLSPSAREALDAHPLPWPKWHRSRMVQGLKKACAAAGIEHVSTNDFRRTFVSWLCQAGVPELTVIKLVGHHSSRMVRQVYAQLAPETLEAAIDALPHVTNTYQDSTHSDGNSGQSGPE